MHADILDIGIIKGSPGQPIAQKTQLGWIISGGGNRIGVKTPIFTIQTADDQLSERLTKFW